MQISVKGVRSKKIQRTIKSAAEFYGSKLLSKRLAGTIDVTICLKRKLDDDAEGFCQFERIDKGIKFFEIEILRDLPIENLLVTLAHEMVHLKQFASGELKPYCIPANITNFKGKTVNEDLIDYWDLPWEIEAHGRERGLFYRFAADYDLLY